jgi:hypothetical protein
MLKRIPNSGPNKPWVICRPEEPGAQLRMTQGGRKTPRRIVYVRQLDPFEIAVAGRFIGPVQYQPGPAMPPRYSYPSGSSDWHIGHRDDW